MTEPGVNRRQFLESSGKAAIGAAALAGAGVVFSTRGAWALTTQALTGQQAASLLRFVFLLFPYDKIGEAPYVGVVEGLDKKAAADAGFKGLLQGGLADLDKAGGKPWSSLPEPGQIAAMTSIQQTPFFIVVRMAAVDGIFNDPKVWQMVGYGGSVLERGGYLTTMNDIDWLPKN